MFQHSDKNERGVYRWWLHYGNRGRLHYEASWRYRYFGIQFALDGESGMMLQFGFGFFISLSWKPDAHWPKKDRRLGISVHNGAIWWTIWRDWREGWKKGDSKWREGSLQYVDILLGKPIYSEDLLEERDVLIPMPEGVYEAHAKLLNSHWKRPRWFKETIKRVHLDLKVGVPVEGKGENAWDCGPDARYGMTAPAKSIAEGVGNFIGDVLHDRVRYGGWKDWTWTKSTPSPRPM